jgi:hypothetical protein
MSEAPQNRSTPLPEDYEELIADLDRLLVSLNRHLDLFGKDGEFERDAVILTSVISAYRRILNTLIVKLS